MKELKTMRHACMAHWKLESKHLSYPRWSTLDYFLLGEFMFWMLLCGIAGNAAVKCWIRIFKMIIIFSKMSQMTRNVWERDNHCWMRWKCSEVCQSNELHDEETIMSQTSLTTKSLQFIAVWCPSHPGQCYHLCKGCTATSDLLFCLSHFSFVREYGDNLRELGLLIILLPLMLLLPPVNGILFFLRTTAPS